MQPRYLIRSAMLLLLTCLSGHLWGQLNVGLDSARQVEFQRSVKQLSEFIERFNADSYEVPALDPKRSLVLDRRQSLLLLFNRDDPRFDRDNPEYSQEYVDLVLKFVDEVVGEEIYLDRYSDQIRAHVRTSVLFQGKPDTMTLILTQEVDAPDLVRWVISDVEAGFLAGPERDPDTLRFLSPVSHELGFMDLRKAFAEPEHLIDYVRRDFEYDCLSVLLKEVSNGTLGIKNLEGLSYIFKLEDYHFETTSVIQQAGLLEWTISTISK